MVYKMENPIKMDDWGVPLCQETSIYRGDTVGELRYCPRWPANLRQDYAEKQEWRVMSPSLPISKDFIACTWMWCLCSSLAPETTDTRKRHGKVTLDAVAGKATCWPQCRHRKDQAENWGENCTAVNTVLSSQRKNGWISCCLSKCGQSGIFLRARSVEVGQCRRPEPGTCASFWTHNS